LAVPLPIVSTHVDHVLNGISLWAVVVWRDRSRCVDDDQAVIT
jgi:hypothetical protein